MKKLIDELKDSNNLSPDKLLLLLNNMDNENKQYLHTKADETRLHIYGDKVYMRGLIEFTNFCKNNCKYCGIRKGNRQAQRYRLSKEEIIGCCAEGYRLGYRTFVLQGGEDNFYTDERIMDIVSTIKSSFDDVAVTLSIGEKTYETYKKYFDAGADRYLLRHETNSRELYDRLHPNMSYDNRIRCLYDLKDIGYQIGAGFMVGLPGQTNEDFVKDLVFLKELQPHMVGIGPFMPQSDTPLANEKAGTADKTCILLSLIRLILPEVLLPATTALGSIDPKGREQGLKAGANVVMPNLSPIGVREKYSLYDGKICTGDEAAQCRHCIENRIKSAGYQVDMSKGDHISLQNN
ncbi:[FeFe] hydrogenase H-cluster radical SAM maturase HydE [Vallitalea longa]|uniref:[FeFe] hydrogenase H-cluster radical SAM maturase HydE n=1 Tax=Vallitalea longa TaxID=2936439 RepID=A0A9W5YG03_9FIRM|nr:[FeFe] hydrogenase H-cluster radical SAM maturase HydE [Vallitalea longa]GKX31971.1 [FeFe] hydrogenase H-cluster radical SAM maturase HydE [Vallitalea longa]